MATYRPEALATMPIRYHDWDRLKAAIRRLTMGDEMWWKDFAVLFFGSAVGLSLSIVIPAVGGTPPKNQMPVWIGAGVCTIVGVLCALAHRSTNQRDRGSAATILERMDDIDTQFTRPS